VTAHAARVTSRGAERWVRGHPWIYRSEVTSHPTDPGVVRVEDARGRFLGQALLSPRSEIRLRLLERTERPVDAAWWRERLAAAIARREGLDATACRLVHGEGDALPSLIVDRYDRWLVAQLLSAGLETQRALVLDALEQLERPAGVLLRHDVPVRLREGLSEEVELVRGEVPRQVEVREGGIRYFAAPWDGQKTGAFLDQRANRLLAGVLARSGGQALDCFAYHGSFALHLAGRAARVLALDVSAEALTRAAANAHLNGFGNIEWREADVFEALRALARGDRGAAGIPGDQPAGDALPRPRRHPAHGELLVPRAAAGVSRHAGRGGGGQRPAPAVAARAGSG
jgi:23S rRNA (cytosine1962-C5)-methyltransferase